MEQARPDNAADTTRNIVLLVVLLNAFATPLMMSATNVALPAMADELALSAVALGWVPMAYLMASAMFVLLLGSVADRVGHRRIFLLGTVSVIASSVFAALSVNAAMLLAGRFLQGISAAMLYATQIALVSAAFPAQRRGQAVGLVVSSVYVGLAAGPLVGGYVIDTLGWRYVFLLQLPMAVLVLLLGTFRMKPNALAGAGVPFDTPGAVAYSGGILLLCLAATWVPAASGFILLAAGLAALVYFARHALRTPFPVWDVRLFFSNRVFTLSCAASLIMYSATYANVVLISLFLQYLKGMAATQAGLVMMVQPLTMALLSPLTGKLSDRIEPRILASLGMAITAVGLVMLARLDSASGFAHIVPALLMTGVGFSLFSSPNVNAIMGSVSKQHLGSASGAVATMRLWGQLISMVLISLMLALFMGDAAITPETYPELEQTIRLSFSVAAALCLPGVLLSLVRGRMHQPREQDSGMST